MISSRKRFETIDEYIKASAKEVQAHLQKIRRAIKEAAPQAQEAISYQIPTFKLHGNLVHFAAFKEHIGFFPPIRAFNRELARYRGPKGNLKFPLDEPMPTELIKRLVRYRVKENLAKDKKTLIR
jgi:uncharacterized protein YdhG (YjbR/CyaY superfamily)